MDFLPFFLTFSVTVSEYFKKRNEINKLRDYQGKECDHLLEISRDICYAPWMTILHPAKPRYSMQPIILCFNILKRVVLMG